MKLKTKVISTVRCGNDWGVPISENPVYLILSRQIKLHSNKFLQMEDRECSRAEQETLILCWRLILQCAVLGWLISALYRLAGWCGIRICLYWCGGRWRTFVFDGFFFDSTESKWFATINNKAWEYFYLSTWIPCEPESHYGATVSDRYTTQRTTNIKYINCLRNDLFSYNKATVDRTKLTISLKKNPKVTGPFRYSSS